MILESSSVSEGGGAVPDGLLLDHRSLWNEWNCLLVQRSQRSYSLRAPRTGWTRCLSSLHSCVLQGQRNLCTFTQRDAKSVTVQGNTRTSCRKTAIRLEELRSHLHCSCIQETLRSAGKSKSEPNTMSPFLNPNNWSQEHITHKSSTPGTSAPAEVNQVMQAPTLTLKKKRPTYKRK